jgi:hypothetical protein
MNRLDLRPWAAVITSVAVMAYVGCSSSTKTEPTTSPGGASDSKIASGTGPKGAAIPKSTKLLANLGNPAAVLIVSGERDGYMEPCGCTEGQQGGLIRLYDFVERLHKQNLPAALIDLGSLTKNPTGARGGLDQAKIKFDYCLRALALLKYSAIALSAEDLKVGVAESLGLFDNSLGDTTKVLAANAQPDTIYDRIFKKSIVVPVGPVKLGITAIVDPEALDKLADPDRATLLPTIKPPGDVLPEIFADLDAKTDYQVLMVQGPHEMAKRFAESYPGFDIVIATCEFDDPMNQSGDLVNGGKTMLVTVGRKGKFVGAFGFHPSEAKRLSFTMVPLGSVYDGPAKAMKDLVQKEYRDTLKAAGIVENFPRNPGVGASFVGAETCKSCHPNTYMKWSTTKHAEAFASLVKLHDSKPNTQFDAECISCHTTGFGYDSGWRSEALTPHMAGNQCENCHGPGSDHCKQPDDKTILKAIALTADQADKTMLCVRCHDAENSTHFEFSKYWGQVVHKGLDSYSDPKVHRGIVPKIARTAAGGGGK